MGAEREEALRPLRDRMVWADGTVDIGPGWWPLALTAAGGLHSADPGYRLYAVKEKWGLLEIQVRSSRAGDRDLRREIDEITDRARTRSAATCEGCGADGRLREEEWERTLCDSCAGTWFSRRDQWRRYLPHDPGGPPIKSTRETPPST